MNVCQMMKPWKAVATLALLLGSVDAAAAGAVVASFDRMLAHRPGPAAPVTAAGRDMDPLTCAIVIAVRDGLQCSPVAEDPIAESFARMLAHTPNAGSPVVPPDQGSDPLGAAMVEPLRQSLSASAEAPRVVNPIRFAAEN